VKQFARPCKKYIVIYQIVLQLVSYNIPESWVASRTHGQRQLNARQVTTHSSTCYSLIFVEVSLGWLARDEPMLAIVRRKSFNGLILGYNYVLNEDPWARGIIRVNLTYLASRAHMLIELVVAN
jgi:hypothetical protein